MMANDNFHKNSQTELEATITPKKIPDAAHVFFAKLVQVTKGLGFNSCQYTIQIPVSISRPVIIEFNSTDYAESHAGILADTDLEKCLSWLLSGDNGSNVIEFGRLFSQKNSDLAANTSADIRWTHSSRNAISGSIGVLTLAHDRRRANDQHPSVDKNGIGALLTPYVHDHMANLLVPNYIPLAMLKLTPREQEVLRWAAEGKTSCEIGLILSVSVNTVVFHLKNAVDKLGATNKTQAAVKAAALGLLW